MTSSGSTTLTDRATVLRDDLAEHLDGGVGDASDRVRAQADELWGRARVTSGQARERAGEIAESLEPARRRAEYTTGSALRVLARGLALVPGVLADALLLLSRVVRSTSGRADELTERGREAAARIGPPQHVRRRNRRRTAGWFAGGVALGGVAGWIAHDRLTGDDLDEPDQGTPATVDPGLN